jgi:hypothetical protein
MSRASFQPDLLIRPSGEVLVLDRLALMPAQKTLAGEDATRRPEPAAARAERIRPWRPPHLVRGRLVDITG